MLPPHLLSMPALIPVQVQRGLQVPVDPMQHLSVVQFFPVPMGVISSSTDRRNTSPFLIVPPLRYRRP